MHTIDPKINDFLVKVTGKSKYKNIHPELVISLIKEEMTNRRSEKEIIKAVAGKLHQVAAAYFQQEPAYDKWSERLKDCSENVHSDEAKLICAEMLGCHSSTNERLPIIKDFFKKTLASIAPVESIIDLACGLNPLAVAWMPVTHDATYYGCDIFTDMTDFLNEFYEHMHLIGQFTTCDLTEMHFPYKAKVAFLLKTLPCLEQLNKGIGPEILERIPADYLLISYPVRSQGGHPKGMGKTYETQFNEIAEINGWDFQRFEFESELAFLVRK
jgi:16S rRNA (guanine(1405)-N(7))-methyltransferase